MEDSVLLLGNGLNNFGRKYEWKNLIDDLILHIGATGQIEVEDKPFPLLYEQILIEAVRNRRFQENQIKEFIAKTVSQIPNNDLHEDIIELGFRNILTTNYEYTLERVLTENTKGIKNEGLVDEATYSLFRHFRFRDIDIWHLHGEANKPRTIMLGYHHYTGYLERMRRYVVRGTGESYKAREFKSLDQRLKHNKVGFESWIDFFFKRNVYIVGFTFDFIEMHLWWLLTYRARRKLVKQRYSVDNAIYYFYPSTYSSQIKSKLDLLKSVDVVPYSIDLRGNNWKKYYSRVLEEVQRRSIKPGLNQPN